jgi:hypothetical protein
MKDKKNYLKEIIIFIVLNFCVNKSMQQNPVLLNSWSFNGDFSDSVGGANVIGGSNYGLTYDRFGYPNSALNLTNGYAQLPPGIYFNGTFTVTMWAYLSSAINNNNRWGLIYFTTKIDDGSNEIYLAFNGGGNNYIIQQAGPILTPPGQINNPNLSLQRFSPNVWMHIAFTLDSSRIIRYYLNGVENSLSYQLAAFPASINRPYNYFGRDYSFDGYANGAYDEIKIYSGAMDSASIMSDFQSGLKPPITTTKLTTTTAKPIPVLLNSWSFDGDFSDSVGGANVIGGSNYGLTYDRFGYPNSALNLTNGYAQLPPGIYFNGTFTVTMWAYLSSAINNNNRWGLIYFTTKIDDGSNEIYLAFNGGGNNYIIQQAGPILTPPGQINNPNLSLQRFSPNVWMHIAFTLDSSRIIRYYLNGVENSLSYQLAAFPASINRPYNYFGRDYSFDGYANGAYDEIKIYSGAMDSASIMSDFQSGLKPPITTTKLTTTTAKPIPVLLNSWSFDGDFSDSVGGANVIGGSNYGLTYDRFGYPNSALNLTNGYAQLPPGIYFNGTFTVTMWAYLSSAINNNNRWGLIYFTTKIDDGSNEIYLAFNGGGNNYIIQQAGPILTPPGQINNPNLSLQRFSPNVWMHIAFTLDSSRIIRYYLNGVENSLSYQLAAFPASINRPYNYFGRDYSFDGYANGAYDEIKIYSGAMDSASIMSDFQSGLKPPITTTKLTTTTAKPIPVLLNSWSFDGDFSDSVGGANVIGGSNYGLTYDRFGYPNSALNLTNGYVQLPPGIYFNGTFTVTMWAYLSSAINNNNRWGLIYFTTKIDDGSNEIYLAFNGGGNNYIIQQAGPILTPPGQINNPNLSLQRFSPNVWMHIAFTLDSSRIIRYYLNGVENSLSYQLAAFPASINRPYNYFGRDYSFDGYANGAYDEIKIYSGAMDSASIMSDFQSGLKPPITTTKLTTTTAKPIPVLLNSWSFDGDFSDSVGGANVIGGSNYGLTYDRFGYPNSALNLTNGYVQLPPGIYFNGTFTVTMWAYLSSAINNNNRWGLIYFTTKIDDGSNEIYLAFNGGGNNYIIQQAGPILTPPGQINNPNLSLQRFSPNVWMHIAFTLDSSRIIRYYLNGVENSLSYQLAAFPASINRPYNYFGRDYSFDGYANGAYDEIKIYSGAMESASIMSDFQSGLKPPITTTKLTTTTAKPIPVLLNSWSFDGDFSDSVGGANVIGGSNYGLTYDRFGYPNSALNLTNGYAQLPPGIYFNGTFTVTMWAYLSSAINNNNRWGLIYFTTKIDDGSNEIYLAFNGGGNNYIIQQAGPILTPPGQINNPNLSLQRFSPNVWMHIAFTLDSSRIIRYYLNGVENSLSYQLAAFPASINRPYNYFGRDYSFDGYANGAYDEIKIYSGAMESASIMSDFQSGLKPPITTTKLTTTTAKPIPVLLNSWSFDGDFSDSVGGANVIGGSNYGLTYDRFGYPNSALNLTNGYAQLPPGIYFNGTFTVTMWAYLSSAINNNNRWGLIYFTTKIDDGSNEIYLAFNGGGNNYIIQQAGPILTPPGQINNPNLSLQRFSPNVWMHIAFTLDSSRIIRYYLNGVENSLSYQLAAFPASINRPYNYFGRDYSFDGYANGAYDEIKIYSGAMESASIMSDFQSGLKPPITTTKLTTTTAKPIPVLLNSWSFDGDFSDSVGGANVIGGSNYGLTYDRFGYPNSALNLTNGYAQLPPGIYFNGTFTVTMWAYLSSAINNNNRWGLIYFTTKIDDGSNEIYLAFNGGGNNYIIQQAGPILTPPGQINNPNLSLQRFSPNVWMHIAFTLDSSRIIRYYLNGVENSLSYQLAAFPASINRPYNYFGRDYSFDGYANGAYDEIKIYSGAMESASIMSDFQSGLKPPITTTKLTTTTAKPIPVLLNSWSFDGDFSDSVGGANVIGGSNYGLTYDRFGYPNSALNLTNGYAQLPPGIYFNGTFTVTMWAYLSSAINNNNRWGLIYFTTKIDDGSNEIYLAFNGGGNNYIIQQAGPILTPPGQINNPNLSLQRFSPNVWMHIAFTLDSSRIIRYYLNGVENSLSYQLAAFPASINRPYNYFGRDYSFDGYANGAYDEIKIYSGAMESASIMSDFQSGLKPPITTTKLTTTTAKPIPVLLNSWSFDGDFSDSVGGANVIGGSNYGLTYDRFGYPNSALNLTNGYAQLPPGIYFNGTFTVTMWAYLSSAINNNNRWGLIYFTTKIDDGSNEIYLAFNGGGNNYIIQQAGPILTPPGQINNPNLSLQRFSPNVWMHIAFTLDSSRIIRYYLNGVENSLSYQLAAFPASINRPYNYFGRDYSFDGYANGAYDEIKIYSGAMDSASIMSDFQSGLKPPITTTKLTTTTAKPIPVLLNSWSFDGDFSDSVGGANVIGGSNYGLTYDSFGYPNSALNLTNGYVQLPPGIYFNGTFTVTMWAYLSSAINNNNRWGLIYFTTKIDDGSNEIYLAFNGGGNNYIIQQAGPILTPPGQINNPNLSLQRFSPNVWMHIAFTLDSSRIIRYYLNGVENSLSYQLAAFPASINRPYNYFGRDYSFDGYANGAYDEIKIYSGAMDSASIMSDFQSGLKPPITTTKLTTTTAKPIPVLLNSWSFDGDFSDSVGGANVIGGSNYGLTYDRFGYPNSALNLTNGYVQLPPGIYFSGPYTVTVWVFAFQISQSNNCPRIFEFSNGGGLDAIFFCLSLFNPNFYNLVGSNFNQLTSNVTIKNSTWTHLAFTLDNAGFGTIYLNGIPNVSKYMAIPNNVTRTLNYFGKSQWNDPYPFAYYDDLKIYKGAMDSVGVMNDYNIIIPIGKPTTKASTASNFIKPSHYWPFDNDLIDPMSGSSLYGGSNYNFVNDRFNNPFKAIRFNNGFLQLPTDVYFSNSSFTITAWANYVSFNTDSYTTLLDFGNTNQKDSVFLAIVPQSNQMSARIFNKNLESNVVMSPTSLQLNVWTHIAYVFDGINGFLYLNGKLVATANQPAPFSNVTRLNCFIGKSNLNSSLFANAIYDEIKIYPTSLNINQINNDMNNEPIPVTNLPFSYSYIGCFYILFFNF